MIRCLDSVRNGTIDPLYLKYAECTRRAFTLELSKYRDVEKMHCGGINSLDIETVEGRYLLSGSSDGSLAIHDLDNPNNKPEYTCKGIAKINKTYRNAHQHSIETIQWYPLDTGVFTSSGMDGQLKIWDTNTLKQAAVFNLSRRIYQHHMSTIATSHCLIAIGKSASQLNLVDLKSGSFTHELRGHSGKILTVRWSNRDEYLLASGSSDNRILVWDIRSSKSLLCSLDQHEGETSCNSARRTTAHGGNVSGLCFTSDGLHLLSLGTDNRLRLWDMCTGHKETVNFGKIPNESKKSVKFDISHNCDPNVVYIPCDSNIRVFDLYNGMEVNTLLGHYNVVNTCIYHPFYQELYSGGNDRNILVWTADKEQTRHYDDYLSSKVQNTKQSIFSRKSITADSWSSDED